MNIYKIYISLLLATCFQYVQLINLTTGIHDWDVLIFTQSWPATVCKEWQDKNPSHQCSWPSTKDSWSIHGIWPTKLGTIGPGFCNKTWHFDPEQIKVIETPLIDRWTNIEKETSTYALWEHEWSKHGTCAAVLAMLNSQLKYFSQGLTWNNNFQMFDILYEADIKPSNDKTYSIDEIHKAIKLRLGKNPAIECRKEKRQNYLAEIRICFDKQLQLTDCDGIKRVNGNFIGNDNIITNCDPSQNISYEEDPAQKNQLYVHLYMLTSWLQWFTL